MVFGADHVYRMDPEQMVRPHIESGAGVTVAGIRVPRSEATAFGFIDRRWTGADQGSSWRSRPTRPAPSTTQTRRSRRWARCPIIWMHGIVTCWPRVRRPSTPTFPRSAAKLIAMVKGVSLDRLIPGRKTDAMAKAADCWPARSQARFNNLTPETIQSALARLNDEGRSAQTANHLCAIRAFLKWCHKRGRVEPCQPMESRLQCG